MISIKTLSVDAAARRAMVMDLLAVTAGAVILIGASRAVLPLAPVPVTLQTLGVLLVGGLLGARRGVASVAAFLLLGITGAPVFAVGGGAAYLLGPTGGYLLGFLPAAAIAGSVARRDGANPLRLLAKLLLADAVVFACGLVQLRTLIPADEILARGLVPLAWGEVIKIAIAAIVLHRSMRA